MHAKCRSMEDAHRVFNKTPFQDVIPWNAMILGHVKWEQGQKPLILFQQMHAMGWHAARLFYFFGGAECMCPGSYT
jgi:hypothetical protein